MCCADMHNTVYTCKITSGQPSRYLKVPNLGLDWVNARRCDDDHDHDHDNDDVNLNARDPTA